MPLAEATAPCRQYVSPQAVVIPAQRAARRRKSRTTNMATSRLSTPEIDEYRHGEINNHAMQFLKTATKCPLFLC